MSIASTPTDILRFLAERGDLTILVTLVAVHGSASRAVGTQMAVAADGSACGSFSGGCIEAAVIAEALNVLAHDSGRTVRYGAGSPYIDVKLPCGGGIDLLFIPRPDPQTVAAALASLASRESFAVEVSEAQFNHYEGPGGILTYVPPLRIVALGQGEDLAAFARLAASFGAETTAVAPAEQLPQLGPLPGIEIIAAQSRSQLPAIVADPWTAIVFLFHDRDWEEFLLPQALALPAFYHAAIGSPSTQAVRRETLLKAGTPQEHLAKLRPTVGLIPSTRDPATLALSILAEVVAAYRQLEVQ